MSVKATTDLGTALYTALNVAALSGALGVTGFWDAQVPSRESWPVVRWQMLDAQDKHSFADTDYQMFTYLVEGITDTDRGDASAIAAAIHTLLNRTTLSGLTGHDVTWRSQMHEYPVTEADGKTYWKSGGTYHIGVRA